MCRRNRGNPGCGSPAPKAAPPAGSSPAQPLGEVERAGRGAHGGARLTPRGPLRLRRAPPPAPQRGRWRGGPAAARRRPRRTYGFTIEDLHEAQNRRAEIACLKLAGADRMILLRVLAAIAIACIMAAPVRAGDLSLTPAQERKLASLPESDQIKIRQALTLDRSLHKQFGDIHLTSANLTLHLGKKFYYLPSEDAKRVLVEGWGNPASVASSSLGLIFPAGSSWMDDKGWGANISFDPVGYVSAVEHSQDDYDKVDKMMREAEDSTNDERAKVGAPPIHYVGWAQPPSYDPRTHTAIWARDLHFGTSETDTLNYDLRTLGRQGSLSMNIISIMPEISAVRTAAFQLGSITSFDPGSRYEDYRSGDKKTSYGIAGLIAAGAGLVVAKKIGLIGVLLLFGKKLLVVVVAAFAGFIAWVRRMFGRKPISKPPVTPAAPALSLDIDQPRKLELGTSGDHISTEVSGPKL